jgi:myo-inositol-1(or 4)-monophosphatase
MISLAQIEKQVADLTSDVGGFIRKESRAFDRTRIEQKTGFNNLVSYVDKESERRIVEGLQKILPGSGFIGEEGTSIKSGNEYTWIIDPLDGTTNFTHGLPPFAISIGLARNESDVVLGIVYEVNLEECFHGSKDTGAFCNGKPIKTSAISSLNQSLLATGFPYNLVNKMEAHMQIIRTFLTDTHGIRRLGSAATDLAYVAAGRLEGFFEYNLNAWDVAAGALLVELAGGKVTDFKEGNNYLFGGELCAANSGVHAEMLQIIRSKWDH